jgi:alkyl sulfatase BDS1-like metallo-beta-lactamase superfamily hydrolase
MRVRQSVALSTLIMCGACRDAPKVLPPQPPIRATPAQLAAHCRDAVGAPRVEKVSERIYVAVGYDLANTIVIKTDHGRIVIDAMMSPERAFKAKEALDRVAPGPTLAVVLTHSHIDHVGAVATWLDQDTQIWATKAFAGHFLKQYGVFQAAERARGLRQFGAHLDDASLPCSALGRKPDFSASVGAGFRMPTHTFEGSHTLTLDGLELELVEAHGETDDQLFVWLGSESALFPGDNYYQAFPNLYTIRGTRPRPVDQWIQSLDQMRRRNPALLIPSHTVPLRGRAQILEHLTNYRDAIAFLRARVVQAANAGRSIGELADHAALPAHLGAQAYLLPLYGELHWSLRAMYTNELGWFDGTTADLYPLPEQEVARRELDLMGGAAQVFARIEQALKDEDPRWALHLSTKLAHAGVLDEASEQKRLLLQMQAERGLGALTTNTNGRAYLLESALLRQNPELSTFKPKLEGELLATIPVRMFFEALPPRLRSEQAADVHETLTVELGDIGTRFHLTVRRGVLEVIEGAPLPGTPAPFATMRTDSATFKDLALKRTSPVLAMASGRLSIDGDALHVPGFFGRFEQDL